MTATGRSGMRLWALGIVANLLLAGGVAGAVDPVGTGTSALQFMDGLPEWARFLLGEPSAFLSGGGAMDGPGLGEDSAALPARGPIGSWFHGLVQEALLGDPVAQAKAPLSVFASAEAERWYGNDTITLRWLDYGASLTYEAWVVPARAPFPVGRAPDARMVATAGVDDDDHLDVPVADGLWDILLRASTGTTVGKPVRLGTFWVDAVAPAPDAPLVVGATQVVGESSAYEVASYSFRLRWDPVSDESGISGYVVERSFDGVAYARFGEVVLDEDSGSDAAVAPSLDAQNVPNGEYRFRVRAVNGAGAMSEPSDAVLVRVDARGGLEPPEPGAWDFGVHAVYDSVLHLFDISDPSIYLDLADRVPGQGLGDLSESEYQEYLSEGWGIQVDDPELQGIVATVIGEETNTLAIGMDLFAWLFDTADYDFNKFNNPSGGDFQRAKETLQRGLGICGDLTALYVTMMRIAGVPARPVHGYLLNQNSSATPGVAGIGGFHMWAEIYVGGPDPLGGGWIPVDVSGVTGAFEERHLDVYFGVTNPNYLQLGVQLDLGDDDLPLENGEEPMENRWNVWANLLWRFKSTGGAPPEVVFQAETTVEEVEAEPAWVWFDATTHQRRVCAPDDRACAGGMRHYFPDMRSRSVRQIDYGATVQWNDPRIQDIEVIFKFPETAGPSQVVMWTPYHKAASCQGVTSTDHVTGDDGFIRWLRNTERSACLA